jgi:glycosyltransferase involved in cell wall biosynthesis
MHILYVFADNPQEWNCSEWRCAVPARAINRSGRHSAGMLSLAEFGEQTAAAHAACLPADVIVVQRNLIGGVLPAIQHWKARGKTIVADFDDAYNWMEPTNPAYRYWVLGQRVLDDGKKVIQIDPPPLTQFKWGLRLVHGATVPSLRLAGDWQEYVSVHYLPNFIDLSRYQNVTPTPHEGVVIGWGGSLSHLESFRQSSIGEALLKVCRARPQVKVMIAGDDHRIRKSLPLPPEQLVTQPWMPYEQWSNVLSKFDIGIAPLHGPYDERRSWIKVMEYMVMKIPWIASDGPAYHELRPFGRLAKNNAEAWRQALLEVVDHLDEAKSRAAGQPYLFGLAQSVDENVERIIRTYAAIAGIDGGQKVSQNIYPQASSRAHSGR